MRIISKCKCGRRKCKDQKKCLKCHHSYLRRHRNHKIPIPKVFLDSMANHLRELLANETREPIREMLLAEYAWLEKRLEDYCMSYDKNSSNYLHCQR